jgi:hypothetical protein
MKKLMLTVCLVFGLLIMVALETNADTVTVNTGSYSSGSGGEFNITSATLGNFPTFCVETSEFFNPGSTYDYVVNTKAMYGSAGPSGDPLSVGTAWLYSQFRAGPLAGYNYGGNPGHVNSAGALQNTIWWLESESYDNTWALGTTFRDAVILQFTEAGAKADAAPYAYGVYVLNLYAQGSTTDRKQDMLAVPEPGILILLGIAMSAIGAASWRIRKL